MVFGAAEATSPVRSIEGLTDETTGGEVGDETVQKQAMESNNADDNAVVEENGLSSGKSKEAGQCRNEVYVEEEQGKTEAEEEDEEEDLNNIEIVVVEDDVAAASAMQADNPDGYQSSRDFHNFEGSNS